MIKGKPDSDELSAKVEATFQAREDLQDALQSLGSEVYNMPKLQPVNTYNVNPNLPDAFKKPPSEASSTDDQIPATGTPSGLPTN